MHFPRSFQRVAKCLPSPLIGLLIGCYNDFPTDRQIQRCLFLSASLRLGEQSVEEIKAWEKLDQQRDKDFAAAAREIGGLKCVDWCEGFNGFETVQLRYWQRNGFVEIHARYESNRYGGLQVHWTANVSDLSTWQSIEHEIWKHIAEWSV